MCVSRAKKFDHAMDPAYAFVTLIFSCDTTTNNAVIASTVAGDDSTWPKATRYICVGSPACSGLTSWRIARNARKEPASSFSTPRMIQPGPADSSAAHQRARPVSRCGGRKRRKSTCSPICTISENTTAEAAPKSARLKLPSP